MIDRFIVDAGRVVAVKVTPRSCAQSPTHRWVLLSGGMLFSALAGCNSLGSGKLAEQLREENERLISEFRAQRDANEKLREHNELLEDRVAESEKLLARTLSQTDSRISSRPFPSTSSIRSTDKSAPAIPRTGNLPSTSPVAGGLKWQPSTGNTGS